MAIGVQANGASISPDPRVARDYSQPVQFTITAPDGTKVVYTVTVKGAACLQTPTPTSDTTPPVITVLGTNPLSLTVGTAYTESGATCVDSKDPSCTVVTTGTVSTAAVGTYTITYTATDAAGNVSSKTRTVNVTAAPIAPAPDTTPPVITVLGANPLSLSVGTAYTEAGATCVDNKDPSCTVVTAGTVNTTTVGTYIISYTATDTAGNTSSKTRVINVQCPPNTTPGDGGICIPD